MNLKKEHHILKYSVPLNKKFLSKDFQNLLKFNDYILK